MSDGPIGLPGAGSRARALRSLACFLAIAACAGILVPTSCGAQDCRHPFPNHTAYAQGTIKPDGSQAGLDSDVRNFYEAWKKAYLRNDCADPSLYYVLDDESVKNGKKKGTICVSEGQGYGMIIIPYMAGHDPMARAYFDGLYRFARAHPSPKSPYLMSWNIEKRCIAARGDSDAATDGDLDIAYGLLLADAQWGSGGGVCYRQEADKTIRAIMRFEMNAEKLTPLLGDAVEPDDREYSDVRSSDCMPGHFAGFFTATGDGRWKKSRDACYGLIQECQKKSSPETGLVPDFLQFKNSAYRPARPNYLESAHDGSYYYNACRVPMRLGMDCLLHGDIRAFAALQKMNSWLQKAAGGDPEKAYAGFALTGAPLKEAYYTCPAFTGPFAIAAMADKNSREWLGGLYRSLTGFKFGDFRYYDNTLKMLCLLILSGNIWCPEPGDDIGHH